MLKFELAVLFFMLLSKCWGIEHVSELLKKHPTWSFEIESVNSMVEKGMRTLRGSQSEVTEDMLRDRIERHFGPGVRHIARKIYDPKWPKSVPHTFDLRDKFKECAHLIGTMHDEGPCHTDASTALASVASDRYCIFTNGTHTDGLSAETLTSCAEACTKDPNAYQAFIWLKSNGLPTGGSFGKKSGCVPYTLAPCTHTIGNYKPTTSTVRKQANIKTKGKQKICSDIFAFDHECPAKCTNLKYPVPFKDDFKKYTSMYHLSSYDYLARLEMMVNGPCATSIALYSDFFDHREGIYHKGVNATLVAQEKFIKLIGWGKTESGENYWLAVNTWDNWGEEKVFKIPRGINYLNIEWSLQAGTYEPL